MITIEFTSSPDADILTNYEFYFDSIVLGSGQAAHLAIADSNILAHHLTLEVIDQKLFIHGKSGPYTVNGKKLSGSKYCTIGDNIGIGETHFKIRAFANTQVSSEERLRQSYREISDTRPDITMLLEALEHELLKLQVQENKEQQTR